MKGVEEGDEAVTLAGKAAAHAHAHGAVFVYLFLPAPMMTFERFATHGQKVSAAGRRAAAAAAAGDNKGCAAAAAASSCCCSMPPPMCAAGFLLLDSESWIRLHTVEGMLLHAALVHCSDHGCCYTQ